MLSIVIRRQLAAFAVISIVALALLGSRYLGIPERLGIGRYDVSVSMPHASGLYAGAPVTYRGVQIGTVSKTLLTANGVDATLSLEDGSTVPRSARADVLNGSVIGEPYINLVALDRDTNDRALRAGDAIPSSRVRLPVSTATMLTEVRDLMASIPKKDLRVTLDESAKALEGSGSSLQRIVDAGNRLTNAASKDLQPTTDLIDNAERVLETQDDLNARIQTWATSLETLTGALDRADPDVRRILQTGGPAADTVTKLIESLKSVLPDLAQDGADLGEVLNTYQPSVRHLLIVLPGLVEANGSAQVYYPDQDYGESGLSFKLIVNDPPVCEDGFPEARKMRAPADLRPMPLPTNSYCKVAHSDPRIVRGARNMPCPQDPSRRGALASDCGLVFNPKESLE